MSVADLVVTLTVVDRATRQIVAAQRAWERRIALAFGVPPWLIGIGKRPPRAVRGQRKTGHHRPHRR